MRLLLLFVALGGCAAWKLPFFSVRQDISGEHSLHPLSPPETNPAAARAKRQAYQVYVGNDVSVSVDKSGEAESGAWGPWIAEGACSRTCGGGVQTEKRNCQDSKCTGPSVRYISCQLEACPAGSFNDFRAEQCAQHNDEPLNGKYYKWMPYKGKNKCELLCKPAEGGASSFYYKWGEKVIDGTSCDAAGRDICVDGVCLPLGCDGKLGSAKKADKCGVCDGKGDTCKTVEGFFDERNLSPGYHDVIKLPAGATSIKVSEARPTSNNLALKNASNEYVLNGNGMIQTDHEVEVSGTVFEYDDSKLETLTAPGPLTHEVTVALLFRKGNKDVAIKYEFSVPLEENVPFIYKPGQWSPCSVTCGKGVQTRVPYCVDTATKARVADSLCDENNSTRPEEEKACETTDCEAEWFTGAWEGCTSTCGDSGQQFRAVYCHQVFKDGKRMTVEDAKCIVERPPLQQNCNRFACPEWQAGPWSACSEKCGDAFQYRSVTCRSEKEGEEGKLLAADACSAENDLETLRSCNLGPCEGLKFFTTEWKLCEKCNDTEETREVTCKDKMGRAYPLEKCLSDSVSETPIDSRTCATQPPCLYEWTTSEWSKCSTECGHGHNTRRVVCAIHQMGGLTVVEESHCSGEKPETKKDCTNEEKCAGTWYSGPWDECTEKCGGGKQKRASVCLNYDHKPEPKWCDESERPPEEQDCNVEPCPTCFDSEFGCCPDNSTFATGDSFAGCSNCSLSEFGCCADNVTEASGPDAKGCLEYVELEEGSGLEEKSPSPTECPVTAGDGSVASVDCTAMAENLTASADQISLLGNETDDSNGTIHCAKTEFGCCPDWFSPASGKNNEGCETYILGNCNGTKFGCCHDDVTLARGPNLEGCGEPSCAASLYGCCKDRKTISFGPHYLGCERSSFPCELAPFGCCPDGETAALGVNGTGCGENCLTTRFGCCPDGKTTSRGHHNEGCGCEYAQFGCCPDGKNAAKGAGFYGCPQGCAQSQYGCCPDGKTPARGANKEGCPCQYTRYGCCPDGETTALGPRNDGCDDCRYAKHGCCADGLTKALGPNYAGCPSTTIAPFLLGGTVAPSKISACALTQDQGKQCAAGFKLVWYYDATEGRCSQFWYGGCEGNENRFATKEQCETICVEPPGKGRCYLPRVEGPQRCDSLEARYFYNHETQKCLAFWWRGCLGNANNFASWAECSEFCNGIGPIPAEPATTLPPPPRPPQPAPTDYEVQPAAPEAQPVHEIGTGAEPTEPRQHQWPTMEDVCRSGADAGPCEDFSDVFSFNVATGKCEPLRYGGCGGNLNKFQTVEDCLMRCGFMVDLGRTSIGSGVSPAAVPAPPPPPPPVVIPPSSPFVPSKSREACQQKVDVGRCQGSFPSFYYEVATGSCQEFKYSGCGGNQNRFSTQDDCEALCVRSPDSGAGPGVNSVCDERKDSGACPPDSQAQYTTKWYYNKNEGVCSRFHFSGCGGTRNRFDTEADCKSACQNHISACELPAVRGQCSGNHPHYYFNKGSKKCEQFLYSGCLGNINRFATVEECRAVCPEDRASAVSADSSLSLLPPPPVSLSPSGVGHNAISEESINKCSQPKKVGPCKALIRAFYYDSLVGNCAEFFYGGCGGNDNRFKTIEDCQRECEPEMHQALRFNPHASVADAPRPEAESGRARLRNDGLKLSRPLAPHLPFLPEHPGDFFVLPRNVTPAWSTALSHPTLSTPSPSSSRYTRPLSPLPELCLLPEERGSCFGRELRWSYNEARGMCTSFLFTGCDANANNFYSQEACERACGAFRDVRVCLERADSGECGMGVLKWRFDPVASKCTNFIWGGCGGNGNRFSSKAECENLCRAEIAVDPSVDLCSLSTDAGPCNDAISQWYFDAPSGECRQFTFGGCRGNGNRFNTREGCESRCGRSQALHRRELGPTEACSLPADAGECTEQQLRWFHDTASGCQPFMFGGCGGNANRFSTPDECMATCQPKPLLAERKKASLSAHREGPFDAGSKIDLTCDSNGEKPIVWYKDGRILHLADLHISLLSDSEKISIVDATPTDTGVYRCAIGVDGMLSEEIFISVKELPVKDSGCHDRVGSEETCRKVLAMGLCSKRRYGKHCCRTCASHGFQLFKF